MATTNITSAMEMKDIYHDLGVELRGRNRKELNVRFSLIIRQFVPHFFLLSHTPIIYKKVL
jgi:hypothetical protein